MRQWIRSHLTYANVVATLALFLVIGGGTALASYVVSSNRQVGPGTISGHHPPTGKHANIIAGSINGKDIADRSGVDTCQTPLTKKFGPICAGSDGQSRTWQQAYDYCRNLGLRLPSIGEAAALATSYDVPGVTPAGYFWTDDFYEDTSGSRVFIVLEDGTSAVTPAANQLSAVCVTDPSA